MNKRLSESGIDGEAAEEDGEAAEVEEEAAEEEEVSEHPDAMAN